jgi:hypothetical protein
LLKNEHPALRDGDRNLIPSKVITLNIDKVQVLASGLIPRGMEDLVVDQMQFRLKGNTIDKADLLFIDLITTSNWERPIYVNYTSLSQLNVDMTPYAVQEGNVYRILPVKNPRSDRDYLVDTEKAFERMINKFKYRGLDDPTVYYTNDYKNSVMNHRSSLNALAEALVDKGEIDKASTVLDFSLEKMPDEAIAYDPSVIDTVNLLYKVGQKKKATDIATVVGKRAAEIATYLAAENKPVSFELKKNLFLLGSVERSLYENKEISIAQELGSKYEMIINTLERSGE